MVVSLHEVSNIVVAVIWRQVSRTYMYVAHANFGRTQRLVNMIFDVANAASASDDLAASLSDDERQTLMALYERSQ